MKKLKEYFLEALSAENIKKLEEYSKISYIANSSNRNEE